MKKSILFFALIAIAILPFCTSSKKAVTNNTQAQATVSYQKDILPLMQQSCTPCHFPETGKKKFLDTYEATRDNIDDILARVQLPQTDPKFMPFKLKKEVWSDSAIQVVKQWKAQGMPK